MDIIYNSYYIHGTWREENIFCCFVCAMGLTHCYKTVVLFTFIFAVFLLKAKLWCHIDFQDGGRCGAILLPVSDCVTSVIQKVNVYQHTKFRQDNSIRGWDITTSGSANQTSAPGAILEYYFLFQFWLSFSYFLILGWHTLPSHASAEACLTGWPNAQPQGRD